MNPRTAKTVENPCRAPHSRPPVSPKSRAVVLLALFVVSVAAAQEYEVTGILRDTDGNPVADAEVWAVSEFKIAETRSDGEGGFALEGVPAGPTYVVAFQEGRSAAGADVSVLGPTSVPLVLGPAGVLELRIVDPEFKPLSGASVRWVRVNDRFGIPAERLREHGFPSLRSGEDGIIRLPALPAQGHVAFMLTHPRYAETLVPYLPIDEGAQTIQMLPGVALRGRVTSPTGEAVDGAWVRIYQETSVGIQDAAECLTDPEGYYHVRLRPGEYHVVARHSDFATAPAQAVKLDFSDTERGVDVAMIEARRIAGVVLGPEDRPMQGILLRYIVDGHTYRDQLTRHDGSFAMTIPAGKGALRVLPPPGWVADHDGDILVTLDTAAEAILDPIRLQALPAVYGVVRDPEGRPLDRVIVSSRNIDPPLWALTDEEGRFHFRIAQAPPDGIGSFRAEHGLRFLRKDFEVDLRKDAPQDLALEPYDPDTAPPESEPVGNDLRELLDATAPRLVTDHWFNSPRLTLDQLRGKVVVLTFWGGFDDIGAGPNRMNELRALHALYSGIDDVVIIGIHDNGSEPEEIEQFMASYEIPFPVGRDVEGFITFNRYRIKYIPQTVLIDKQGRLRHFQVDDRLPELIKGLRREG